MIAYLLKKKQQTLVECSRTRKTKNKVPKEGKVIVYLRNWKSSTIWKCQKDYHLRTAEPVRSWVLQDYEHHAEFIAYSKNKKKSLGRS